MPRNDNKEPLQHLSAAQNSTNELCYFCGNNRHPRSKCPAREVDCNKCGKKGHFAKVCKSSKPVNNSNNGTIASTNFQDTLASIISGNTGNGLSKSICTILINNSKVNALIDSGSMDSFIHPKLVDKMSLTVSNVDAKVQMASTSLCSKIMGMCSVDIELNKIKYENVKFKIMKDLCADVILGLDFQSQHGSVTLMFSGVKDPLIISSLSTLKIDPPKPFQNLTKDCKPVASKSRHYSDNDKKFIASEVERLYSEGIIQPSTSPWRSQVVVTKNERSKKRLVIDYSETITDLHNWMRILCQMLMS